tara:strand:+ start:6798 stop:7007 length:210 start_codon:yes stop_codon:yes gene_type:complete
MPNVGGKEFPYTPKGMAAAKNYGMNKQGLYPQEEARAGTQTIGQRTANMAKGGIVDANGCIANYDYSKR